MMRIRPITEADIDAVATVHVRTWQIAYAGIVPAEHLAAMDPAVSAEQRRARRIRPDQHTLVAEEDGEITGFVSFGPYRREEDNYDEGMGELYAIYVSPDHWGKGIGRELLRAAKTGLAAAGFPDMRLWVLEENHGARQFYERMDLEPDGMTHVYTPRGTTAQLPELRYATPL